MSEKRLPRACRHGRHRPRMRYFIRQGVPAGTFCTVCGALDVWHKDRMNTLGGAFVRLLAREKAERAAR